MIPSLNSNPDPPSYEGYICDCCAKFTMPWVDGMYQSRDNPIPLKVGGVTYLGCSRECNRILFMIHQQYAMREGK